MPRARRRAVAPRQRPVPSRLRPVPSRQRPVPLRHRLPNPPPVFVGRKREAEALAAAIRRAPLTVLCGPGGVGKTALVLHTLHRHFAKHVERTLTLSLQPDDPAEEICIAAIRVLAEIEGARDINWPTLRADREALTATAIDLAEAGGFWLVVDNVHHADMSQVAEILGAIGTYARRSRWVIQSRVEPVAAELAPQCLKLAGMPADELAALGRALKGTRPVAELERAVAAAQGFPWRLCQRLLGTAAKRQPSDPLAGCSREVRGFLQLLALLRVPFPAAALRRIADTPPESRLVPLVQQGLLEHTQAGFRLHDEARPALEAGLEPGRRRELGQTARAALVELDDPVAHLEALRLAGTDAAALLAILDRHGEGLLAAGFAPELSPLLAEIVDERLEGWRLRVAVERGDPGELARVALPTKATLRDHWMWVRACFARGSFDEAADGAREVARMAARDLSLAFDAGLLRARALRNLGHAARALDELRGLAARDEDQALRRDVAEAVCAIDANDRDGARRLLARARPRLARAGQRARLEAGYGLVGALYKLGELREAASALETVSAACGERALFLEHGRMLLLLRAGIAADLGQLDQARAAYDRLAAHCPSTSGLAPYVRGAAAANRLAMGELAGLEEEVEDLARATASLGADHDLCCNVAIVRTRLALQRGEAPAPPPASVAASSSFFARRLVLVGLEARIRRGEYREAARAWPKVEAYADNAELEVEARVGRALASLLRGRGDSGLEELAAAHRRAREAGLGALEAETLQVRGELCAALGRAEQLARTQTELGRLAQTLPSARLATAARFFAALSASPCLDPAALELLAASAEAAPAMMRRARALLGGTPFLDAVDRAVIDGARALEPRVAVTLAGPGDPDRGWTPAWGLDEVRNALWLPNGRSLRFTGDAVGWRILVALAEHDGTLGKEGLAQQAWGVREYHPLKHDNRLRLAIRKLRRVVEDDPAQPRRLLTTTDGYALGGPVRRLRRAERGDRPAD